MFDNTIYFYLDYFNNESTLKQDIILFNNSINNSILTSYSNDLDLIDYCSNDFNSNFYLTS